MDYNYSYAAAAGASAGSTIISLIIAAFTVVCLWFVFKKAGEPGWAAIVPFYNLYVLFKITYGNGWKFLLLLIPVANIVFGIIAYVKLAKAFGKSTGFAVGLVLLCPIFLALLAFGDAQYVGVPA